MPNTKIVSEYKYKDGFSQEKYVEENIEKTKAFVEKTLMEINAIDNRVFQAICTFSLIDSFAQEEANYSTRRLEKSFSDFVLKYQRKYDFLEKIEPITLFYDVEEYIDEVISYPELYAAEPTLFPPEKEISLDEIALRDEMDIRSIIDKDFSERLLEMVGKKLGDKAKQECTKQHCFVHLLYKMRSKLVHELSHIGVENKWEAESHHREPFYRNMSRLYTKDSHVVSDNIFELIIPNEFIMDLAKDCITNYLEACLTEKRLPFANNSFDKKVKLSWNDKDI